MNLLKLAKTYAYLHNATIDKTEHLVDVDRTNLIEINSVNDNFLRRVIHHFKTIEE